MPIGTSCSAPWRWCISSWSPPVAAVSWQAARSLDVKPTLLRKTLARLEERLGLHLFVHEGNALSLTREAASSRLPGSAWSRTARATPIHGNSRWCAWRWRKRPCTMLSRERGYLRKNANSRSPSPSCARAGRKAQGRRRSPSGSPIRQPHPAMGPLAAPTRIAELSTSRTSAALFARAHAAGQRGRADDSAGAAPRPGRQRRLGTLEPAGGGSPVGSDRGTEPRPAATGDPLGRLHRPAAAHAGRLSATWRRCRRFDEPMRREVWMSVQPEAENRVEVRACSI